MTRTVPGRTDHVVVVGAGLSGLAATLHLLGAGRRVTLVERDTLPGGRAGRLERGGYRIDTGPTVLTMPDLADEAFAAVGTTLRERVDLIPLHPAYRALFADGSGIDVHTDPDAMEAEVERFAGAGEAAGYRRLRGWLERLYRAQMRRFIDTNFDSPLQLLTPDLARLAALGGFGRLDARIGRHLRDERLRRVFSFQALYAGVPPARALAAYAVIAYMDTVAGVYFPRGGMHALPRAMADAAAEAGADLRFGQDVVRLERSGDRVTAVVTAHERIACDAVVLTPDLPVAYALLGRPPRRPLRIRHAPSAVVLHAGTDRTWPQLAHHTLSFGTEWRRTFDELTRTGELMSDPSLLITRPTATDPTLAPPGHHLHYILAPCPNTDIGPDAAAWGDLAPRYRDSVLRELERRGFDGLADAVQEQALVTPADWHAQGHAAGTPFSAAHTFAQTGPFRPRNLVRGTANAVLAGCGTTPGVGVPTVLLSGKLAAARITGRHTAPAPRRRRTASAAPEGTPS
ncbi:phytoene desaturase family protein [Streptomyces caniscabiei]|uniref:Phytoene desaturase family protein n=1 Tax=Streptomyces caniscabiei TaxID=2746961 RepID=A0ABU4MZH4_9ACTN|nr:phytoene desaturase family protein [Streptomyces caniscabiei]MBE4733560.1 phytoene desaturase [Streptomyces caniscabiei]MBE4754737.1 phytoene desaturase [Streptomyces caniscabiei]MBE4768442.1 phytoene desaturase [Streptomyces caniscabiei]MBE4782055.1 phytoene desaturase [Streptomyces caniscabiei]MBE4793343.1 phytoene desaturase [Streptomyces caniscabiei]